jgi:hypothetical protein
VVTPTSKMRSAPRWVLFLVGLTLAAAACSSSGRATSAVPNPNATEVAPPGDIPDNQVFVPYAPAGAAYTLKYPEGWVQQQHADGATTFTHDFNRIAVSSSPSPSAPTTATVQRTDVPRLRSTPGFVLVKVDTVPRTAGRAIRIVYRTTSTPDPVTLKRVALDAERYLFWHNGKLVTITFETPHGSDNVDAWRTITNSLVWR